MVYFLLLISFCLFINTKNMRARIEKLKNLEKVKKPKNRNLNPIDAILVSN